MYKKSQIENDTRDICKRYEAKSAGFVMNVLSDILQKYRYIPLESLEVVSDSSDVSVCVLEEICKRSDLYTNEPVGEHLILLCNGTVCHNKGAVELLQSLKSSLGIDPGGTTSDGRYTLRVVNCVGSCSNAPLIMVDDVSIGHARLPDISRFIGCA